MIDLDSRKLHVTGLIGFKVNHLLGEECGRVVGGQLLGQSVPAEDRSTVAHMSDDQLDAVSQQADGGRGARLRLLTCAIDQLVD